jgi:hypothetical protein
MILLFLTLIPGLLWDEGPQTAPVLEQAGIREIATTGDASAWSSTRVRATAIDGASLIKLDPPGVDYQLSRGGATAAPWINSNLWRVMKEPGKSYVYEVSGAAVPLAAAEAYVSGGKAYLRLKQDDLAAFASALGFLHDMDGPPLPPRVNFGLVDDGTSELDEVLNLLIRRNLLFDLIRPPGNFKGPVVRIGTPEYSKELAGEPYKFSAVVRAKIGDDHRLVRIYGSETTIVRLSGSAGRSRLHVIQYGRNAVPALRVRVLGHYQRVLISALGQRVIVPEDVTMDDSATEFTIPAFRTYAVVDLDAAKPGVLESVHSDRDFPLTADPAGPEWRSAPSVTMDRLVSGVPAPIGPTEIRSRWTSDSLYLLYVCPYNRLSLKPDPFTDRDTPQLWNWDVAEAFIGGDFANIGQYREYQVSPQGEWVDLDIDVVHPKPAGGMGWNSGYEVKARIDDARKVWYAEMRIPLTSIIQKQFQAGDRLRLGLFRMTGPQDERLSVAWQPSFRHSFHVPEAFGTLILR